MQDIRKTSVSFSSCTRVAAIVCYFKCNDIKKKELILLQAVFTCAHDEYVQSCSCSTVLQLIVYCFQFTTRYAICANKSVILNMIFFRVSQRYFVYLVKKIHSVSRGNRLCVFILFTQRDRFNELHAPIRWVPL